MKTIKNICTAAIIGLGLHVIAQTAPPAPPTPPAPPAVYTNATTKVTTNSSNVSVITQNGDNGKGGNTSFSSSNSNGSYRIKSRYPKNRYQAIKEFLLKEMGTKNMQSSGKDMVWSLEGDEDTVYEIELSEKRLNIELDKHIASPDMIGKFNDMGNILRSLVSGGSERQEIERLERDADRAQRDAARMQREANRLRAMSEQDAVRLSEEAALLEREAERLSLLSKRGGGIDGYVREVLGSSKTMFVLNGTQDSNWKWPAMQEGLLAQLSTDNLITGNEDVVFIKEDAGIYVNGVKLNPTAWSRYNKLFRTYNYGTIDELSFYKQGNHIAVITNHIDLEDILEELEENRFIRSADQDIVIEINGRSVLVNGKKLSQSEVNRWNDFLHKNDVIPAPGKSIVIGRDFASIGYSIGKNTLGSWISKD